MPTKNVQLKSMARSASVLPSSIDKEKRTVEVVWSTGAKVFRSGWLSGDYYEELSMDEGAVRMGRLNNGAPFLNAHNACELEDVIGVVEKAWIENGVGKAVIRFSERQDVEPIWKDVQDGILRNVSVGYNVYKYQDLTPPNEETPTYKAIDWEPCEISAVPVGADAEAGFRSETVKSNPCEIITRAVSTNERENMLKENNATAATNEKETPVNIEQVKKEAGAAEKKRASDILTAVRKAKLGEDFAQDLIDADVTIDQAREKIIDKVAERSNAVETKPTLSVQVGDVRKDDERKEAAQNSMLHRYNPTKFALTTGGREFRGMSLIEVARFFLEVRGINTKGMTKMELATRAFESTSDFPALLANVANKTLRMGYESAPQSFRPIVRENQAPDFKQIQSTNLSDAPSLEKVNESGEIKRGSFTDGKEVYQLATYAKIVPITRQAIINDDIGAFTKIPAKMGLAAADLESDTVWDIFNANAALSDSIALFHASHGNLAASGTAIDVTNLGKARAAMKKQKNLAGRPINLSPKFLIVNPDRETEAEQLVGPIVPSGSSNVNPFSGKLQILSEARLTKSSNPQPWYVACDPAQCDIIEISYLEGQQGAYMESRMGFDVDGIETKVRLDFAAKALDFRGVYKNPGA